MTLYLLSFHVLNLISGWWDRITVHLLWYFRNSGSLYFGLSSFSESIVGSFCFSSSTGLKRSPHFLTRTRTSSDSNTSEALLRRAVATSFQVKGVETVGRFFARSE